MATVKESARTERDATSNLNREPDGREGDSAQEKLNQPGETVSVFHDQARTDARQVKPTFWQLLKDPPLKTVWISASVGWLIGRFWRHR